MRAMPGFAPFCSLPWVTPDLERSIEQFKTIYNVPSFCIMEPTFNAVFNGEQGSMSIRMALANIDDHQIELIQPVGEGSSGSTPMRCPRMAATPMSVHHVCTGSTGRSTIGRASRQPRRAGRSATPATRPTAFRFAYTDEARLLGLYIDISGTPTRCGKGLQAADPAFPQQVMPDCHRGHFLKSGRLCGKPQVLKDGACPG